MEWYNQFGIGILNTVNKNVGDIVYLTATGSGGVAPYKAAFRLVNGSGVILVPSALTGQYKAVAADAGKTITFYAKVTDSCSTPQTSSEVSSTAIIAVSCTTPTCGFSLA